MEFLLRDFSGRGGSNTLNLEGVTTIYKDEIEEDHEFSSYLENAQIGDTYELDELAIKFIRIK